MEQTEKQSNKYLHPRKTNMDTQQDAFYRFPRQIIIFGINSFKCLGCNLIALSKMHPTTQETSIFEGNKNIRNLGEVVQGSAETHVHTTETMMKP